MKTRRQLFLSIFLPLWFAAVSLSSQTAPQTKPRIVHAFVALADNEHQGIIPVRAALGNGDDADRNLYWGAAFGVRTYFRKSPDWKEVGQFTNPSEHVLGRIVFQHRASGTYLIADAYRGREIKRAITDFFQAAAGKRLADISLPKTAEAQTVLSSAEANLVVYVGRNGLMDFSLAGPFPAADKEKRSAIVLACASQGHFGAGLRATGAAPLLWTTGLMAPEAYTLKAALDGWIAGESAAQIHLRAATAYAKYQKCKLSSAQRLFSTAW